MYFYYKFVSKTLCMIALPKSFLILCQLLLIVTVSFSQVSTSYTRNDDGIIVYPDTMLSNGVKALRLQVIGDNIIRVTASPEKEFPQVTSLAVINAGTTKPTWQVLDGEMKNAVVVR